jgi:enoyl-CoA hydratase/carnithine racemase
MSFVDLDRPRPGVTLVTLKRPERRNSMAFDLMVPLRDALVGIGRDGQRDPGGRGHRCRDVDAAEAERIGLVSAVHDDGSLLDACFDVADRIAAFSRPEVELTKRALWGSMDASSLEAHMDAEGTAQLLVRITTRNFEEAVRARKEGRPPEFRD